MVATLPAADELVLLRGVSWETYERILTEQGDRPSPRLTYDRGELELWGPSTEHERDNGLLALLVEEIAIEWSIELLDVGSMTFRRAALQRGFEADSCFYIAHLEQVTGKDQIDAERDPPQILSSRSRFRDRRSPNSRSTPRSAFPRYGGQTRRGSSF